MKLDADDDGALRVLRRGDDRATVGERAQIVHVRQVGARDVETNRLGAGREQQRVVRAAASRPSISTACARDVDARRVARARCRCVCSA